MVQGISKHGKLVAGMLLIVVTIASYGASAARSQDEASAAAPPAAESPAAEAVAINIVDAEVEANNEQARRALKDRIDIELVEMPLMDALDYLAERTNTRIHLDRAELTSHGVAEDAPVTLNLKNLRADMLLEMVLTPLGLDYAIRDGVVWVSDVTVFDAEEPITRSYDLSRLFPPQDGNREAEPLPKTPEETQQRQQLVTQLIELLQQHTGAEKWESGGGIGRMTEYRQLVVVTHLPAVHRSIEAIIRRLDVQLNRNSARQFPPTDVYSPRIPGLK